MPTREARPEPVSEYTRGRIDAAPAAGPLTVSELGKRAYTTPAGIRRRLTVRPRRCKPRRGRIHLIPEGQP